jgi:NADPH-dependent ferric siderophore reductase
VLTGTDLEPQFPFPRLGSADHVKLALPDPVTGQVTLPSIRRGEGGPEITASTPPVLREYTIRAVDYKTRQLTIDFVLHEHGPAGRWAATASPGAPIGLLGPRGSHIYPNSCADYLLVADETGLPAVERFLEELPAQAPVTAVVLAAADSARDLAGGQAAQIRWLTGTDPAAAVDAVAGLPISPGTFVWAAAEAAVIRALRTHLLSGRQSDTDQVEVRGYWRRGTADAWTA